jgi:hypothetical protein
MIQMIKIKLHYDITNRGDIYMIEKEEEKKWKNDYHAVLVLRTTKLALSWSVSLLWGSNCCCCCLGGGDDGAPISKKIRNMIFEIE